MLDSGLMIMHLPHCKLVAQTASALLQQHAELNKDIHTCKNHRRRDPALLYCTVFRTEHK